ncbi:MAG TPA: hypothetical protein VMI15_01240 [Burkholderiales bacterium]|nr:hypothetical protein [Burkholderiales bacterium]
MTAPCFAAARAASSKRASAAGRKKRVFETRVSSPWRAACCSTASSRFGATPMPAARSASVGGRSGSGSRRARAASHSPASAPAKLARWPGRRTPRPSRTAAPSAASSPAIAASTARGSRGAATSLSSARPADSGARACHAARLASAERLSASHAGGANASPAASFIGRRGISSSRRLRLAAKRARSTPAGACASSAPSARASSSSAIAARNARRSGFARPRGGG